MMSLMVGECVCCRFSPVMIMMILMVGECVCCPCSQVMSYDEFDGCWVCLLPVFPGDDYDDFDGW